MTGLLLDQRTNVTELKVFKKRLKLNGIWFPQGPAGFPRVLLVSSGSCWFPQGPAGFSRVLLVSSGSCWFLQGPAGFSRSCWFLQGLAGFSRVLLVSSGSSWSRRCGCVRRRSGKGVNFLLRVERHRRQLMREEREDCRMDVMSYCINSDVTNGGTNQKQFGHIVGQPAANGPHLKTEEAPPHRSDWLQNDVSGHDLATDSSTPETDSAPQRQKGVNSSSASPPPLCSPPSSSSPSPRPPLSSSSTCSLHQQRHHRGCTNQQPLSSSRSHTSSKAGPAHIKEVAGDDCCLHCLLACLFCEVLSMCSALGECLVGAVGGASCCDGGVCCCCCCVEAAAAEEACQTPLDCGIAESCCSSSDCLEICLECCSICFPT